MREMTGTGRRRYALQQRCTSMMKLHDVPLLRSSSSPTSAPPTKASLPGTPQNGEPQLRVVIEHGDSADDLDHQLPVETVQLADVVDRDMCEVAAFRPLLAANQDTHRAKSPAPTRE